MTVRVLLFGHYRDAAPAGSEAGAFSVTLPSGVTVIGLAAQLGRQDWRLADLLSRTRVAVGAEFTDPHTALHDGDEVAFLPPMSGG